MSVIEGLIASRSADGVQQLRRHLHRRGLGLALALTLGACTTVDLVASMLADADAAVTDTKAVERAVRASGRRLATNPQLDSWFEDDDNVTAAIKGKRKIEDRIAAIIENVLEPKRAYWASVIAWSAFAQRGDDHGLDWIEMALVAREMASERPPTEIPLARFIAVQMEEAART